MALAEEWNSGDVRAYRLLGGYAQLMEFLWEETQQHGGILKLLTDVKKIVWKPDDVEIITNNGEKYSGSKILITVPLSVLKADVILFDPPLLQHRSALRHGEMGEVIKFLFEFKDGFWERKNTGYRYMPSLNFLFSDAFVPTWWTQKPDNIPMLTGWLAGPIVPTIQQDDAYLVDQGIRSLAYLFGSSPDQLDKEIRIRKVVNWSADPFSRGAYAYKTLHAHEAIGTFSTPV